MKWFFFIYRGDNYGKKVWLTLICTLWTIAAFVFLTVIIFLSYFSNTWENYTEIKSIDYKYEYKKKWGQKFIASYTYFVDGKKYRRNHGPKYITIFVPSKSSGKDYEQKLIKNNKVYYWDKFPYFSVLERGINKEQRRYIRPFYIFISVAMLYMIWTYLRERKYSKRIKK